KAGRRDMNGTIPHPIPYQGSKRNLARRILALFPPKVDRLVEPSAGSAAVALAAASRGIAKEFWLNDAHAPINFLWKMIVDHPRQLADQYAALWNDQLGRERRYYNLIRTKF